MRIEPTPAKERYPCSFLEILLISAWVLIISLIIFAGALSIVDRVSRHENLWQKTTEVPAPQKIPGIDN